MNGTDQQSAQNLQRLTATLDAARETQEQDLVLDFDAALKEHQEQHKPLRVRLLGETFELPSAVPFSFVAFAQRHCFKTVNGRQVFDASGAPAFEMIERLFGEEMLARLEQSNVPVSFVMERVVPGIMERWGLADAEGDAKKPD